MLRRNGLLLICSVLFLMLNVYSRPLLVPLLLEISFAVLWDQREWSVSVVDMD